MGSAPNDMSPKTPIKTLKRTTTGVSVSSFHSKGRTSISNSEWGDSPGDDDATTHQGDTEGKSKSKRKQHVPIEKDAWVKAFGEGYVLTMRRKNTYIEEIN